jgi:hypothetical protein
MEQGCPADSGAERDPRPDPGNTGVGSFTAEIRLILIASQTRAHPTPMVFGWRLGVADVR